MRKNKILFCLFLLFGIIVTAKELSAVSVEKDGGSSSGNSELQRFDREGVYIWRDDEDASNPEQLPFRLQNQPVIKATPQSILPSAVSGDGSSGGAAGSKVKKTDKETQ